MSQWRYINVPLPLPHASIIYNMSSIKCRGKSIATETEQMDTIMFGSARDSTHPVTTTINKLETRISEAKKVLDGIAVPRLHQSQECLSFHLLQHRCQTLTSALCTLTSSTSQLPPIGHSLESANATLQQYLENSQTIEVHDYIHVHVTYTCIIASVLHFYFHNIYAQ